MQNKVNQAQEVARHTRALLATKGWCLRRCSALDGEVTAVARDDDVLDVPEGYPVYAEVELKELCRGDVSQVTLRLVHEARKLTGAKVESGFSNEILTDLPDDVPPDYLFGHATTAIAVTTGCGKPVNGEKQNGYARAVILSRKGAIANDSQVSPLR